MVSFKKCLKSSLVTDWEKNSHLWDISKTIQKAKENVFIQKIQGRRIKNKNDILSKYYYNKLLSRQQNYNKELTVH